MRVGRACASAGLAATLGCATVVNSSSQSIRVVSEPRDVRVRVYDYARARDVAKGETPATFDLPRGGGYFEAGRYRVTASKEGFQDAEMEIRAVLSPWFVFGNLVLGGLVGWIVVDPTTGAMWRLEPDVAFLKLAPVASEAEPESESDSESSGSF